MQKDEKVICAETDRLCTVSCVEERFGSCKNVVFSRSADGQHAEGALRNDAQKQKCA